MGATVLPLCACDASTPQTCAATTASGAAISTGAIAGTDVWATIDCGVVSFAGCSPPLVTVTIKRTSDSAPVKRWHGAEGPYQIAGLAPGSYSVEAYTDAPGDASGAFGSAVPVQAGITTPNIDIALQPADALCLVVYQGHDATVSFKGPGANDWCSKLTRWTEIGLRPPRWLRLLG